MPKVTFLPSNETRDAQEGESILDVALNYDISIQHACGGFCACTTCHVVIKSGMDHLSPIDEDELERLEALDNFVADSRLGCQARIHGDVVAEIRNPEEELF